MSFIKRISRRKLNKEEIENISLDILWMVIDILEENDVVSASDEDVMNFMNGDTSLDDFWHFGYSLYGDDSMGVKDRLNIYFKSVTKYKEVLKQLNQEKSRMEDYTGVNIKIFENQSSQSGKYVYISVLVDWKGISDRVNDFKSFSKFIYKHIFKR